MDKDCSSKAENSKDPSRPSRNTKAAMGMVLFLSAVFLAFTSLLGDKSLFHLHKMQTEKDWWARENTRQTKENEILKRKSLAARDDLFIVEKSAREELGLVKENEVIYLFDTGKIRKMEQPMPGAR